MHGTHISIHTYIGMAIGIIYINHTCIYTHPKLYTNYTCFTYTHVRIIAYLMVY